MQQHQGNLIRVNFPSRLLQNLLSISATCCRAPIPKRICQNKENFTFFLVAKIKIDNIHSLRAAAWQWHAFMRDAICSRAKIQFALLRYKTAVNFHPRHVGAGWRHPKIETVCARGWLELHLHRKYKIYPKLSIWNWAPSVGSL